MGSDIGALLLHRSLNRQSPRRVLQSAKQRRFRGVARQHDHHVIANLVRDRVVEQHERACRGARGWRDDRATPDYGVLIERLEAMIWPSR